MYCVKCGKQVADDAKFCLHCGAKQNQETQQTQENSSDQVCNTIKQWGIVSLFIRKNTKYYERKFADLEVSGGRASWNWAAFFFPFYWCFYRKLYKQGALMAFINIACSFIPIVNMIVGIVIAFVCGMFGNSFYYDHIMEEITECDQIELPEELVRYYVLEHGGVNMAASMLSALLMMMASILTTIYTTTVVSQLTHGLLGGLWG